MLRDGQLEGHAELSAAAAAEALSSDATYAAALLALRLTLNELLPAHMRPRLWRLHASLPLTVSGKLDRVRLASDPQLAAADPAAATTAPQDPIDEVHDPLAAATAAVWREMLGVAAIGSASDFFALGGDSMLAMRLTRRLCITLTGMGPRDFDPDNVGWAGFWG